MCSRFSLSRISLYLKQCIFKVISFLFLELSLSRTKSSIALEFQIERVYVYSIFTLMQYKFKSLFRNKQNGRTFRRKVNFFFFFLCLRDNLKIGCSLLQWLKGALETSILSINTKSFIEKDPLYIGLKTS